MHFAWLLTLQLRYVWKTKIEYLVDRILLCTISVCVPAVTMGELEVASTALLEQVRQMVNKLQESSNPCPKLSPDWCFVDCKFPILQLANGVLIWGDALKPCKSSCRVLVELYLELELKAVLCFEWMKTFYYCFK